MVLSTANPYKFPQSVLKAISGENISDAFKSAKRLYENTACPIPEGILSLKNKEKRFSEAVDKSGTESAVLAFAGKK